jgi:hypothetical protein
MKNLLNNISQEEKNRILEMHKLNTENNHLTDLSELQDKKTIISEQMTLLNIPSLNIMMSSPPGNQSQILLKGVDPKTKQTSVLKYNIEGSYGMFDFDVNLRAFKRYPDGALYVEAKPNNRMVSGIVSKLVPKGDITADGYIKNFIKKEKIDQAITLLKQNKGSECEIDAGHGVTINLTLA